MTNAKSVKKEISVTPYVPVETKDKMEVWEAFRKNLFRWRKIYFPDISLRSYLRHAYEIKRLIFRGGYVNITQSTFADFFNSFARGDE
jgi:hypothetical protein